MEPAPHDEARPGTGEVHLWRVDLDAPGIDLGPLSADERARAARLLRDEPRRRWQAGRAALRTVLGGYLGIAPAAVQLRLGRRGKPALADPAASLRFNLSHSDELALIALARGREVGVDVERIGERPPSFYAEWTRREALGKCFGGGFAEPPPARPARVVPLDVGEGWTAALAVAGTAEPCLRRFELDPAELDSAARRAPAAKAAAGRR
jgi:hypothetical protein